MTELLLAKIADRSLASRDSFVDEINDRIEQGSASASEVLDIVDRLAPLLASESDPAVMESIFNLLGSAFDRIGVQESALQVIIALLDGLSSGCLVHAIPIIGRSKSPERRERIFPFLASPNIAVRAIAEEALQSRSG